MKGASIVVRILFVVFMPEMVLIFIELINRHFLEKRYLDNKRGGNIGRLLILEFDDDEMNIFDELMKVVKSHPDFKRYELCIESSLQLPGLEIYPDRRKIYRDRREISLTAKEFDILCYLATNRGRVMTYAQIYQHVWGDYVQDIENNTIGYHICNLKEKLFAASPCSPFNIRCVRNVGYCFELVSEEEFT